ncbi:MAG TPA: hypothetical protein VGX03_31515 [Candidatus Binatia bacterium]|nr:hypothetical protein [Candidatus Binatia bacterium]
MHKQAGYDLRPRGFTAPSPPRILLQLTPKSYPWMPASAGMTEMAAWGVIPAQAGIQSSGDKEVLGQLVAQAMVRLSSTSYL